MASKKTNGEKQRYLNPPKPLDCMRAMMRGGMPKDKAKKHCDSLWKKEEGRRDEGRTVLA